MKQSLMLRFMAFTFSVLLAAGLAGCGTEWETLALEILGEWADQHDINPSTAGGAANLARRAASDSTGDEEADAAIGYDTIIENIEEEGEEPEEETSEIAENGDDTSAGQNGEEAADTGDATISSDPATHVEGFIAEDVAGATGSAVIDDEQDGVTWDQMVDQLSERIKSPSNITAQSSEDIFDTVREITYEEDPETGKLQRTRESGHDVVDITLSNGDKMRVGVMVTPEGRILYTGNGKDFYDNLETITDPSLTQQASDVYTGIKDAAWSALFEGGTGNKDIDLQNRVASEVMDDLRTQLNAGEAEKNVADWTEGQFWDKNVKGPLQENVQQLLWDSAEQFLQNRIESGVPTQGDVDALQMLQELKHEFDGGKTTTPKAWGEIKKQSGLDLFDLVEVDGLKAGELAVSGAEFALEATKTMGRGLQDTDFALRARSYIELRQANQSPQLIWQRMRNGELSELDIGSGKAVSGGVSSMMASSNVAQEAQMGVMFTMFEQAYQRYNIAKEMGR